MTLYLIINTMHLISCSYWMCIRQYLYDKNNKPCMQDMQDNRKQEFNQKPSAELLDVCNLARLALVSSGHFTTVHAGVRLRRSSRLGLPVQLLLLRQSSACSRLKTPCRQPLVEWRLLTSALSHSLCSGSCAC